MEDTSLFLMVMLVSMEFRISIPLGCFPCSGGLPAIQVPPSHIKPVSPHYWLVRRKVYGLQDIIATPVLRPVIPMALQIHCHVVGSHDVQLQVEFFSDLCDKHSKSLHILPLRQLHQPLLQVWESLHP
jgi:hypothetical protein